MRTASGTEKANSIGNRPQAVFRMGSLFLYRDYKTWTGYRT